jgi:phosphoglycerol geranylgeranyltransferase
MMRMSIKEDILEKIKKGEKIHLTLIDPENQSPEKAVEEARNAKDCGTDYILVGGSTISQEQMDNTVKAIKPVGLPVILFPSEAKVLSKYADGIFFISLFNSRNPRYIIREQAKAMPFLIKMGIEIIPVAYIITEPGGTVGKVGEADLITDVATAVEFALAGQGFGMFAVYTDAGSGASKPVSNEIIRGIRKDLKIPLIVGGGIKDAKTAKEKAECGADIIITSNTNKNVAQLGEIISAIKQL